MNGTHEEEQQGPSAGPDTLTERPGPLAVEPDCPKCTGPVIRCQVGHVGIYGWWLERVSRPAGVLGPPRTVTSEVAARVCTRCGYTELYARDPGSLALKEDVH